MFDAIFDKYNDIVETKVKENNEESSLLKLISKISGLSKRLMFLALIALVIQLFYNQESVINDQGSINGSNLFVTILKISAVVFFICLIINTIISAKEYLLKERGKRAKSSKRSTAIGLLEMTLIILFILLVVTAIINKAQNDYVLIARFLFCLIYVILPFWDMVGVAETDEDAISVERPLWEKINNETREMIRNEYPDFYSKEGIQWIIDTSQNRYKHVYLIDYFYDWIGNILLIVTIAGTCFIIMNIGIKNNADIQAGVFGRWVISLILVEYVLFIAFSITVGIRRKEHDTKVSLLSYMEHLSYIKTFL